MRRTKWFFGAFATLFLLLTAAPAQGQVYVSPFIGSSFFPSDLSDPFQADFFPELDNFTDSLDVEALSIESGPAFGTYAGIRFGSFGIEGMVSFTPTVMAPRFSEVVELRDATTGDVIFADTLATNLGFDVDVITFGGNVSWQFVPSKLGIRPYLTAGAGGVNYDPDEEASEILFGTEEEVENLNAFLESLGLEPNLEPLDSTTEFMFNLGAGIEIPISGVTKVRFDLRDYISSTDKFRLERLRTLTNIVVDPQNFDLDSKTSHNIVLTAGLTFGG